MYRIDNSSASNVLDPPSVPGPRPNHYFSGGNPAGGIQATILEAEWANMLQEEICNVVLAAAMTLDKADRSQLLKAIRRLFRMRLSAPLELYVSPSGNDAAGDGLSPATAWRSPQVAWNWMVANLDPALNIVTVHLAPGTYPGVVITGTIPGVEDGTIRFLGNVDNPSTVTIHGENQAAFYVQDCSIGLFGVTLTATGVPSGPHGGAEGMAICAGPGSTIWIDKLNFGACSAAHLFAESSGSIWLEPWSGGESGQSSYTISGSAPNHYECVEAGFIATAVSHVTIVGNPHFDIFCLANALGQIACWSIQWTGTATGKHFQVGANSVINIGGANPDTYFPGNVAGDRYTGGIVI